MRIINAHAHVLANPYEGLPDASLEALGRDMEKGGIEKSLVFSSFGEGDKYNYDWVELSERIEEDSRFELIYTVTPGNEPQMGLRERILSGFKEKEAWFKGFKVPLGYRHVYPNDERLDPIYDLCEEHDLPMVFHTGDTFGDAKLKYAHPLNIDDLASERPDLKIIMAHVGNPWTVDAAAVMEKNKNVYGDLSGLFIQYDGENHFEDERYRDLMRQRINDLIAYAGGDKLLFGTDFPLADSVSCLKFIDELDLTEEEKERTLYENAGELFKL